MMNGVPWEVPRPKNPLGLQPLGFWPFDLPRYSSHQDTPLALPNNVPIYFCSKNYEQYFVYQSLADFHMPTTSMFFSFFSDTKKHHEQSSNRL